VFSQRASSGRGLKGGGVHTAEEGAFLDLLYGAVIEPELWVQVMERFADLTGGTGAWLSRLSVANGGGSGVIARIDPEAPGLYNEYYGALNPFAVAPDPAAYMRGWTPCILTEDQCMGAERLRQSEYFNDFMRPQDIHSVMIVRLAARGQETCGLTINRTLARGRFERENVAQAERLHDHLRRAFAMTERLAETGLTGVEVAAALDHTAAHGLLVLDPQGRIRNMNREAERIVAADLGLHVSQGRLTASAPAAARRLEALIALATTLDPTVRQAGSMALPTPEFRTPISLTVTPVMTARHAVFGHRPSAIVCVTDPDAPTRVSAELLRQMFGFTPAESRVALAILEGATVREAACALGVSFHTARHQLQSIMQKAGVARQVELVALMSRAGVAH
jgi:DNA-binding CsgD family transcriptional regulator